MSWLRTGGLSHAPIVRRCPSYSRRSTSRPPISGDDSQARDARRSAFARWGLPSLKDERTEKPSRGTASIRHPWYDHWRGYLGAEHGCPPRTTRALLNAGRVEPRHHARRGIIQRVLRPCSDRRGLPEIAVVLCGAAALGACHRLKSEAVAIIALIIGRE